jgi:hypothetical protein
VDASTPQPTPPAEPERLKLRALDEDDLAVLAAFLQDSIACVGEMAYLPEERRFVLAVCRFRWEQALEPKDVTPIDTVFERVECVVTVDTVAKPKYRGFKLRERSRVMPILTTCWLDDGLEITFGGGAALRLEADRLDLRLEDIGPCWPTRSKPEHGSTLS